MSSAKDRRSTLKWLLKWEPFIHELAKGRLPASIGCDEGMPSAAAFRHFYRRNKAFRARVNKHYVRPGHSGANKYRTADWDGYIKLLAKGMTPKQIEKLPGHPYSHTFRCKRRKDPQFAAKVATVYTPRSSVGGQTDWQCYIELLKQGMTPTAIERLPGHPCAKTFRDKRRIDPVFAARAAEVYKPQCRGIISERKAGRKRPTPATIRRRDLWSHVDKAVSATIPSDARHEIIAEVCRAVLEGSASLLRVEVAVKRATSAYWQTAPSKYGPASLDALLYEDGRMTLGDTISRGLWDY